MLAFGSLLIVYLILFFSISWRKAEWGIFLIIAALPSYAVRFHIGPIPMTLLEGMIIIIFIARMLKKIFSYHRDKVINCSFKSKIKNQKSKIISKFLNFLIFKIKIIFPIILFILAATINVFTSPNRIAALGIWKAYFIEPVLFLFIFINVFRKKKIEDSFLFFAIALAVPSFYISIFAVYQRFFGFLVPAAFWQQGSYRVTSFFSYPNAIGLFLAPITIILLGTAISLSKLKSLSILSEKSTLSFRPSQRRAEESLNLGKRELCATAKATGGTRSTSLRSDRDDNFWTVWKLLNLFLTLFIASAIILSAAAIIFAKSEGAIVGLAGGLIIFGFLSNKRARIILSTFILFTIIFSAAIYLRYGKQWDAIFSKTPFFELDKACEYPPLPPLVKGGSEGSVSPLERPARRFGGGQPACAGRGRVSLCKFYQKLTFQDISGEIRREMWGETISMLKDRPFLGAGLAGYQRAMEPYHAKDYIEIYLYPHNFILNFWSETGLLGIIAFLWILILFFYSGIKEVLTSGKNQKLITITLISAMAVLLIHGLVDVPYFKNDLAILFWVIFGMMIISARNPRSRSEWNPR